MSWKTLAFVAAAILALGAAPVPKAAPAKSAPAKAAVKPAARTALAPRDDGFDARDPASMVALLALTDAKAVVAGKEADSVFLKVTTNTVAFIVQFAGCDPQGRKCRAVQFDNTADKACPTLGQINGYNQTSATCRSIKDKSGQAHVLYSTLLLTADSRDRITQHLSAWQGCLAEFRDFVNDPTAYLAAAP